MTASPGARLETTFRGDSPSTDGPEPAAGGPAPTPPPRRRRRIARGWIWLLAAALVIALIMLTVALFTSAATNNRADDPRSVLPSGTSALAQLLSDEGVRVQPADDVETAARQAVAGTTLVVANADRLRPEQARQLLVNRPTRVILLRPTTRGLAAFGAAASTASPDDGVRAPGCEEPAAQRAGAILLDDARAVYTSSASPAAACYPGDGGAAWLRTGGVTGSIDLVAGGVSNADLGEQGNAAFGMNVFGSQPTVVWLMAERQAGERPERPTLLPSWWAIGIVQLVVALIVIGIWRGRRLGPIMVEPLPVRVRSSETVVGHGRLYFRIAARDRAAEALRAGARERLGRRFGHRTDPDALVTALAQHTGRPAPQVATLLYGPAPTTDEALLAFARALDDLEQEAGR